MPLAAGWKDPEIPKTGWYCIQTRDIGYRDFLCEMCQHTKVRYIHSMKHPIYPHVLLVGRDCADSMSIDSSPNYEPSEDAKSWMRAADRILKVIDLTTRERGFVESIRDKYNQIEGFESSEAQNSWFVSIYKRVLKSD
jgi:hypothetical protein